MAINELILDSKIYFSEAINSACEQRKLKSLPIVNNYLVNLLNQFIRTENLYVETENNGKKENLFLAKMYLEAVNSEENQKNNMLRRLGDICLYFSGFFGDSFKRKIIDVDYYIGMGENAYDSLAKSSEVGTQAKLYREISNNFVEYVDVFTIISQECSIQKSDDILRLYEKYLLTDSEYSKDKLIEKGCLNFPLKKITKQ